LKGGGCYEYKIADHDVFIGSTPSLDAQIENMKAFAALDVDIAITELDIRLDEPETTANLAQQSLDYEGTVGACMQVKECIGITVWDFYDPVGFSSVPLCQLHAVRG
jgi:endo-1,4-beta-xylanase